ncbi:hypothetical protein [uncultured Sphingomonas sp.]|uniref:hypothetical protein n=1 Tax=uncultured Sphingomonas sp. TaxID=158754 RepID=UPI0035C97411
MRTSRKVALSIALASAAQFVFGPALGQDRPESILPPGFGQPQTQPTAEPSVRPSAAAGASTAVVEPLPTPEPSVTQSATPSPTPTADPTLLAYYELPPFARRPLGHVGPVTASDGGLPADAFGVEDGRYLETLMRRLSAPLPSRWLSILLRRALLSEVDTPHHVDGANFAAERAWLLLRMGESVGARAVVQAVDDADYTPKLYQVALNAMLATGDPAGLCPLADRGRATTGEPGWALAQAMCAGLTGAPKQAATLIAAARRRHLAGGVDLLLARKVAGAGGGQAITIEWDAVDRMTPWRFGLATATGVAVPDPLLATTGPQMGYWRALAPAIAPAARVRAAEAAAAQGVLSNAALVDLYASLGASTDDDPVDPVTTAAAQDLGAAYADPSADARLQAIKRLWGDPTPYARLVLTARAAARVPPSAARAADADRLVAAMLTAGLTESAARWRPVAATGGDAWAMLAVADPGAPTLRYSDLSGYAGSGGDARLKQRLLFAGLAGLGRLQRDDVERAAAALDVRIGATDRWTAAIDRAAANGEVGTVVLLAAIGMQTPSWRGVPPAALYRIVAALRAVGMENEARMIAAEAIARA